MRKLLNENLQETFEKMNLELSEEEQGLLSDILSKINFREVVEATYFELDIREELQEIGLGEGQYESLVEAIKEKAMAESKISEIHVSKTA